MKKYVLITALAALALVLSAAHAEDAPKKLGSPAELRDKRLELQDDIKEKRAQFASIVKDERESLQEKRKSLFGDTKDARSELEETIKARREALRQEIDAIKKERATVRKEFVQNRFTQVIAVLQNHHDRIETKIAELESKGHDLSEAKMHLDAAETSLQKAKDLLATLTAATVSDTDASSVTKPRETAKKVEEALKETRMHLVESIHAVKDVINPDDKGEDEDETASTAKDD